MKKIRETHDLYLQPSPSNENIYSDLESQEDGPLPKYEQVNYEKINSTPGYLTPEEVISYSKQDVETPRNKNKKNAKHKIQEIFGKKHFKIIFVIIICLFVSILTAVITYVAFRQPKVTCTPENCQGGQCQTMADGSICLMPASSNAAEEFRVSAVTGECPQSWSTHDTNCYKEFMQLRTWHQARDYCRSVGADLVTIHKQSEMEFIDTEFSNVIHWIGLKRNELAQNFKWIDGSSVTFTNWTENEPNNHNNIENCVRASSGTPSGWQDANCYMSHRFICKMPMEPACENADGHYYDGSCYFFERGLRMSWSDASDHCYGIDPFADLVHIDSLEEHNFIVSEASKSGNPPLWIGLSNVYSDKLEWPDASELSFTMWADGEPSLSENEVCVKLHAYGFWYTVKCDNLCGFICEKRIF